MSKRIAVVGIASGLTCLMPMTALAQAAAAAATPASAASPARTVEIARVVITAQKRKEDIHDVPLSVSVLSGEQLQAQQVTTVEDLTRNIPNVSFTSQAGPGLGTVEIRGVSSQAGSATVSVYLDDVSLTTRNLYSQGTAEPRFFDLQDAEVLRGPQGTLYGASSLGGTIKFVSKSPDMKYFGGSAMATVSDTFHGGLNYETQAVLNIPLVKNALALRIGAEHGHESGYIDQVDPTTLDKIATGINSDDYTVVKMMLKANMGNGWSLTPALFVQQTDTADIDAAYSTTQSGVPLPRYETSKTVREPGRDRLAVPSVTLNGDTDAGTFTAVLSGYQRRFNRVQDGTAINDLSWAVLTPGQQGQDLMTALDSLRSAVDLANKIDQTSFELRMASKDYDPKGSVPFTWIGGAYFQNAVTQVYDDEPIFNVDSVFAAAGVNPGDPDQLSGGFAGDLANNDSYYSARHYHDKQSSVFGELTYHWSPSFQLTAGIRELHATQTFTRDAAGLFYDGEDPLRPGFAPGQPPIAARWTATTPSFKLNWDVDPDTAVYFNASKGFRLGGANRPVPDTPAVEQNLVALGLPNQIPVSFAPDSLWSYELGSKSDLLSHRVSLSVSAFFLDWKNIQQDINLSSSGFDFETNAGNATSYGLEAELKARVTPELTLSTSVGFTHATFSEDEAVFGVDSGGNLNVRKGDLLPGVPKASASMAADYHWAVNDDVGAFVRGNAQWTGTSHGSFFSDDADYKRDSYFTLDASVGVNWDKWEITGFVKNANNNHTQLQHPNIQSVDEAYYLRPRTIGITANCDF